MDTREGMVRLSPLMRHRATYKMEARSLALFTLTERTESSRLKSVTARHGVV
jgi:hypothetical protein